MGGKNTELALKNAIVENTGPLTDAHRPDMSGNSKHSVADVVIITQVNGHIRVAYIELKTRNAKSGNRSTVMAGSSKGQNGINELEELLTGTPPWGDAYVVVKFDHRESIIYPANKLHEIVTNDDVTGVHGARQTRGGNISIPKPTLDNWNSSTSGVSDWEKIMNTVRS